MMNDGREEVKELHKKLAEGIDVSDGELLEVLNHIRIMTNAEYAAVLLVNLFAPILWYKPHLTRELLTNGASLKREIVGLSLKCDPKEPHHQETCTISYYQESLIR